jgi:hypothetical protein
MSDQDRERNLQVVPGGLSSDGPVSWGVVVTAHCSDTPDRVCEAVYLYSGRLSKAEVVEEFVRAFKQAPVGFLVPNFEYAPDAAASQKVRVTLEIGAPQRVTQAELRARWGRTFADSIQRPGVVRSWRPFAPTYPDDGTER